MDPSGSLTDTGTGTEGSEEVEKCRHCKLTLPLSSFPLKVKGSGAHVDHTTTCADCTEVKRQWRRNSKAKKSGGEGEAGNETSNRARNQPVPPADSLTSSDTMSLAMFLGFLRNQPHIFELEARVSIPEIQGELKARANTLAHRIWEKVDYRFM